MAIIELNKQAKKEHKLTPYLGDTLPGYVRDYEFVGSRVCCDPPPQDTDNDILCLIPDHLWGDFIESVQVEGWKQSGDYPYEEFMSLRKKDSDVNLLATRYYAFYKKFVVATYLCKKLNLLDKAQRIAVHEAIIDGVVEGVPKKDIPYVEVAKPQWAQQPPAAPVDWGGFMYVGQQNAAAKQAAQQIEAILNVFDDLNNDVPAALPKAQAEAAKMNELKKNVMKKKKAFWL